MKPEIKQRIEQLNNGKIPKGYKKTDFGVFPSDWVTDKTLGDLFDFYGGLSKSRDELGEEGYAYLHYGDLHRGTFNTVSIDHYEQLPKCDISLTGKEKCLMKDGDVAFLDASEDLEGTSRAVLIDNPESKPFIAGLHIIYGKAKNNNLDKWFKQYITSSESVKKQFQRLSVGFKVYGVNRDTIPHIKVAFPSSNKEQSRIAEILMKWDKAIELYDKQIDALTRYKAVCLKKMFPIKGQSVPEWRFQGFSGDWEQRKVGDLLIERNQQAPMSDEYPLMAFIANEGVAPKGERYDRSALVTDTVNKLYKKTEKGDFIYSSNNLETGSIGLNKYGKACISPVYSIFEPTGIADSDFLGRRLVRKDFINAMVKWRQGVIYGQWRIHESDFLKIEIPVPSVEEQRKIGAYLDQLDNLITLYQRKKEVITNQRKTLQQYLLNGIIRV